MERTSTGSPASELLRFSRTGGCAAKLNAADLLRIVGRLRQRPDPALLTDYRGNEDAAAYRLDTETALIATIDVIAPPVADPNIYGQIAAANALSDVYAMGGSPLLCLGFMAIPEALDCSMAESILAGAAHKIDEAAALLVGGHTVRNEQLLFGVAAIGTVPPERIWRNATARPGDALVLTKPVGMGVLFSALRRGRLTDAEIGEAIRWASTLNRGAAEILSRWPVHAATDVTGFGLLGHALEVAKASNVSVHLWLEAIPTIEPARSMYEEGIDTGITSPNSAWVGEDLRAPKEIPRSVLQVLADPQTNGGLLAALGKEDATAAVRALAQSGLERTAMIGEVTAFDGTHLHLRAEPWAAVPTERVR